MPAPEPTPASTTGADQTVERTVLLDAGLDQVREALASPDLLSAWLGDWIETDDGATTVVTDDGVIRTVERRSAGSADEICWRWSPVDEPSQWSDVRFMVTTEGERTRLTVTESLAPAARAAGITAPAVPWLGSLIALGAVLAVGSLVAV